MGNGSTNSRRPGLHALQKSRRSIPPGTYFRMILIGYFKGIASQRGIAWRASDSLSLRVFLGCGSTARTWAVRP